MVEDAQGSDFPAGSAEVYLVYPAEGHARMAKSIKPRGFLMIEALGNS